MKTWEYKIINVRSENYSMDPRRAEELNRLGDDAYDPYAFVRDAYLQRRQYAVYDGDVPEEQLEDDSDWAEEALRESEEEE